jgi:phosphate transport system protein
MSNIIRDKFLDKVSDDFNAMTAVVLKQLERLGTLVATGDKSQSQSIRDEMNLNERIIDSLEVKMHREVTNVMVLYGPRTSDLRQVMSKYDMSRYLERVGDLILNIVRFLTAMDLDGDVAARYLPDMRSMLSLSSQMINHALAAFNDEDNPLALSTIESDDSVDAAYHDIGQRTLADYGGTAISVQQLTDIISINGISYNIERIADNATNIAEAAIYNAQGKTVMHTHLKKEEQSDDDDTALADIED